MSAAEKASAILNANSKPLLGGAGGSSVGAGSVTLPSSFQLKAMASRTSLRQQLAGVGNSGNSGNTNNSLNNSMLNTNNSLNNSMLSNNNVIPSV